MQETSRYETDIEALIEDQGVKKVVNWLRNEARTQFPKKSFTPSDLMKHVGKVIVAKIKTGETNDDLKSRAQIVFNFLCYVHQPERKPKAPKEFVENGLGQIWSGGLFPIPFESTKREGNVSKYRSLANVLNEDSPGSMHSLKFGFAVFGFYAQDYQYKPSLPNKEESANAPARQQMIQKKRTANKPKLIALLFTGVIISGFVLYFTLIKSSDRIRPRVNAIDLFSDQHELRSANSFNGDTLTLKTISIHSEHQLSDDDTIALGTMRIRLKVRNYSENQTYFPDALFLKPLEKSTLTGKVLEGKKIQSSQTGFPIVLKEKQMWPYEWVIINDSKNPFISPKSEVYMLLEISGKDHFEDYILAFSIMMKFHDSNGDNLLIGTDRSYKLGIK